MIKRILIIPIKMFDWYSDQVKKLNIKFTGHDKIMHFSLMAFGTFWLTIAFSYFGINHPHLWAYLIFILVGAYKEIINDHWLGKGTPSWDDMFANILGINAGAIAAFIIITLLK